MGQKINPVSLRLHYTNRHFDSCWYSNYFYKNLITKDILLRNYFNNFLKLLKLPTGRYSIQHLQKKTQVYNFFCYSKSTREWRSKLFGLAKQKNSLKKSKYFFKNNAKFKRKNRKQTKLSSFYCALNQVAIHKIQRKITGFQNFQLWSRLLETRKRISDINSKKNKLFPTFVFSINNSTHSARVNKSNFSQPLVHKKNPEKINQTTQSKNLNIFSSSKNQQNLSNLVFLQNLVIYKTLKLNSKKLKVSTFFFNQKKINDQSRDKKTFLSLNSSKIKTLEFKYKNYLESSLSSFYGLDLELTPFKVKNDWQYASYLADEIVYFLEKRIPFRRLKTRILKQLSKISAIRGVRITCSGRVGGKSKKAQRAKVECLKYGQTSLQVFSSKIDFCVKTAFTSFGSVGVKVWICYN